MLLRTSLQNLWVCDSQQWEPEPDREPGGVVRLPCTASTWLNQTGREATDYLVSPLQIVPFLRHLVGRNFSLQAELLQDGPAGDGTHAMNAGTHTDSYNSNGHNYSLSCHRLDLTSRQLWRRSSSR